MHAVMQMRVISADIHKDLNDENHITGLGETKIFWSGRFQGQIYV